jgi:transposase, IS30 family
VEYHRLTPEDRYQIEALLQSGMSIRAVSRQLKRAPSTICRELKKSSDQIYRAQLASVETQRRLRSRFEDRYLICGRLEKHVRRKLKLDWSPEQIAGRMKINGVINLISHQSIYRYIERRKKMRDPLFLHLRILRKERNDRKKPQWRPNKEHQFPKTQITERPEVVELRNRLGDYERDTVYGKINGAMLLTIVDRTSRLSKLALIRKKTSKLVHQATLRLLKNEPLHTITNDNGAEFSSPDRTEKALNTKIYYSQSYRSWQRGTNENTNGLIRQYFPKETPIVESLSLVKRIERRLNSRPRKCLGYKTPHEVHQQLKRRVLR